MHWLTRTVLRCPLHSLCYVKWKRYRQQRLPSKYDVCWYYADRLYRLANQWEDDGFLVPVRVLCHQCWSLAAVFDQVQHCPVLLACSQDIGLGITKLVITVHPQHPHAVTLHQITAELSSSKSNMFLHGCRLDITISAAVAVSDTTVAANVLIVICMLCVHLCRVFIQGL